MSTAQPPPLALRVCLLVIAGLLLPCSPLTATSSHPVKIIFDTDYSTDCDDPGALAVLHALADLGEAEILATGASTGRPKAPGAIDVVNTYYGRPDIPVCATKIGPTYNSAFTDHLHDNFPHDTPLSADVPDAVDVYRRVLAAQPDHSVVFVTVGYLTNMAELLKSPPDAHSPLDGRELVAAKVREWACMGGNFWNLSLIDNVNFSRDVASADHAIKNFPNKLTFIPREVASVPSPLRAGEELNQTPMGNPVRIAYHKYFNRTTGIDRHVADLATVLYAVRGHHDYWDIHTEGTMTAVHSDGRFTWDPAGSKDHNHLVMKGGLGVYSNKTYVEGVLRGLLARPRAHGTAEAAPVVAVSPQNRTVPAGATASFSVEVVANPPPSYQWLKNGVAIPGANGALYTTPAVTAADDGALYRVAVANTLATVFSADALLTVLHDDSGGGDTGDQPTARYTFDQPSGSIHNQGSGGSALDLTQTGGATGRDNTGPGGHGATASPGLGAAFDVLAAGDNTYHTATSPTGGGLLTAAPVLQSALQGADGAFTYEALVALSTASGEQTILAHDGATTRGFLFRILDGALSLYHGNGQHTAALPASGAHAFVPGAWYHVAVAYTGEAGATDNLKFYWTALAAPSAEANLIGTASLAADLDGSVNNHLGVGTTTRSPHRFELRGLVDEVRLHQRALASAALALPRGATPSPDTSGDGIPDAWALEHGFDPALDIAGDDTDGDGLANLLEYALGLDPLRADSGRAIVPNLTTDQTRLRVTFHRIADPALAYVVEATDDLASGEWTPVFTSTGAENVSGPTTVEDSETIAGHSRRFLRLVVLKIDPA